MRRVKQYHFTKIGRFLYRIVWILTLVGMPIMFYYGVFDPSDHQGHDCSEVGCKPLAILYSGLAGFGSFLLIDYIRRIFICSYGKSRFCFWSVICWSKQICFGKTYCPI